MTTYPDDDPLFNDDPDIADEDDTPALPPDEPEPYEPDPYDDPNRPFWIDEP